MNRYEPSFSDAIRVLSLKPVANGGKLVAVAAVEIETAGGSLTQIGCPAFESPNKYTGALELCVAPPSKVTVLPNGTKRYEPVAKWHPDLQQAITRAVAEAWQDAPGGFDNSPRPARSAGSRFAGSSSSRPSGYGEGRR